VSDIDLPEFHVHDGALANGSCWFVLRASCVRPASWLDSMFITGSQARLTMWPPSALIRDPAKECGLQIYVLHICFHLLVNHDKKQLTVFYLNFTMWDNVEGYNNFFLSFFDVLLT
jgi:hypothetical protein